MRIKKRQTCLKVFYKPSTKRREKKTGSTTKIVTMFDGTIILTEDTNTNVKENTKPTQWHVKRLNNLDFEKYIM